MEQLIKDIAKVELHCHLDGSVSVELIKQLGAEQGIDINEQHLQADKDCENLETYLNCFDEVQKVLQTKDSLRRSVIDVAEQATQDNVKYIELRFAPLFHMEQGLAVEEVIAAVILGAEQAMAQLDIKINLLICAMRQHDIATNSELFDRVIALNSDLVCGIDFAGPEAAFPPEDIAPAIQYGLDQGLNLTLHAGECGCMHNVVESIKLGAQRIGHGVAINNNDELLNMVKTHDVLLEICPQSNMQTKAIESFKELNLPQLIEQQVPFIINTDNRTVTQTTLNDEYVILYEHEQLTLEQMKMINKQAVNYAFLTDADKDVLQARLEPVK
ncbi:adenosine deaminase [Staphylococcus arlettae]|uniref:adenosine deaminase n=1 Tax=Staphylococcus arlettae TaxID=29378 RepID=UPI000D1A60D2|nr:adenosine deaminase [Staphylococcus arlettae]PTH48414.1 adenosine deaminase [Staphylococcus arlettae]